MFIVPSNTFICNISDKLKPYQLPRFHVPFQCLSHDLAYLLYFCPSWDRS